MVCKEDDCKVYCRIRIVPGRLVPSPGTPGVLRVLLHPYQGERLHPTDLALPTNKLIKSIKNIKI